MPVKNRKTEKSTIHLTEKHPNKQPFTGKITPKSKATFFNGEIILDGPTLLALVS